MSGLLSAEVDQLLDAFLALELADLGRRSALFNGLPPGIKARLEEKTRPLDQLLRDLDELSRQPRWSGLTRPPLAIYFDNAARLAGERPEREVIAHIRDAYLVRCTAQPAAPTGWAPPPGRVHAIRLTAPIGDHPPAITLDEVRAALHPAEPIDDGFHHRLDHLPPLDGTTAPWAAVQTQLAEQIRGFIRHRVQTSNCARIALFGFAPIPLLAAFGRAIGDKQSAIIFERHRHTDGWRWDTEAPPQATLSRDDTFAPTPTYDIALLVSISDCVKRAAVERALGGPVDMLELRAEAPRPNLIRTVDQLKDFGEHWRLMLNDAHAFAIARGARLHLFAATPLSVSIELGRRLLPNADPPLTVYDYRQGEFVPALILGPPDPT